jgi:predicted MFS family arabinose efflux permease
MPAKKFILCFVLSLFYAYQYVLRVIPATSANELILRFGLDAAQFGNFCSIYYIGYTAVSIPLGIAIDRYNARTIILLTISLVIIGIASIMTNHWYLAIIGRFITGVGSAGAILSLFKVISVYFEARQGSKILGITITIGLLGAIYGGKPLAILINQIGFDLTIVLLIIIGCIIAIATYLLLPKKFPGNVGDNLTISTVLFDIRKIFKNKALILLAIIGGLMVGPIEGFVDGWSVLTFKIIHNWPDTDATLAPSVLFLGMCIGASLIGMIIEKTQRYYTTIVLCNIMMICGLGWILWGNGDNILFMLILLFLIGLASAYQIVIISKVGLLVKDKLITTATAITNMIIMIFGSIYHTIIGNLIISHNSVNDDLYSIEAIQNGITPLIIGLVIGLVLLIIIKRYDHSYQNT